MEFPGTDVRVARTGRRDERRHRGVLTGRRLAGRSDRVLATVLFTDICGSTDKASEVGDRAWHELLDQHNALIREQLARWRGREIKTLGDGFVATFDGPARVRCAAPWSRRCAVSTSRCAPGSTRASARSSRRTSAASPCIGARVNAQAGPRRGRLEHGQGARGWLRPPVRRQGATSSAASPASGACSRSSRPRPAPWPTLPERAESSAVRAPRIGYPKGSDQVRDDGGKTWSARSATRTR